jgi:hypothetical protein
VPALLKSFKENRLLTPFHQMSSLALILLLSKDGVGLFDDHSGRRRYGIIMAA